MNATVLILVLMILIVPATFLLKKGTSPIQLKRITVGLVSGAVIILIAYLLT